MTNDTAGVAALEAPSTMPTDLAQRIAVALECGVMWTEGAEAHPRMQQAQADFNAWRAGGVEGRPVTQQEDQWLRDAAKRSSTLVAPGKLVEKCEFPLCAVHHICDRNCTRNAGVTVAPAPAGKPPEDSYPDQTILHAEGECGNCLQATIAGVLGWPLAAVPHFALLGEDHWWDCAQAWLNSQGYWIDYQPTSYAAEGGELMPRCWLSGRSPRGFSHAVVGDSATLQMLHDPHPSRAGLVEHSYTIYFFRKPAAGVKGGGDAEA